MPHSKHRVSQTDARQDRSRSPFAFLVRGKWYALLAGLLALSLLLVVWLGDTPAAWATSPVSPVAGIPAGDATSGSVFWGRIRAAFSWRSPLPWFLIGLPSLGLLGWGLLWGFSRLEAVNRERSRGDQVNDQASDPVKDREMIEG